MTKHLLNLPVVLAAVFSLAACVALAAVVYTPGPTKLLDEPIAVPDFTVTTHDGATLTRDDLLGEVWVCDFFLTRCTGVCPMLGQSMADLADAIDQKRKLRGVRLVSFSVDPEHDTPDVMAAYREKNDPTWSHGEPQRRDAIDRRWVHAAADDQDAFWQLVNEGFLLTVGANTNPEDDTTPVSHSSKLVLVDREGNIRGYYDGLVPEDMDTLFEDLRRVAGE